MKQIRPHTRPKYTRGLMNGRVNFTVHGVASATSACMASGAPYVRYILALKTRVSMKGVQGKREGREIEKERPARRGRVQGTAGKASWREEEDARVD